MNTLCFIRRVVRCIEVTCQCDCIPPNVPVLSGAQYTAVTDSRGVTKNENKMFNYRGVLKLTSRSMSFSTVVHLNHKYDDTTTKNEYVFNIHEPDSEGLT